MSNKVIITIAPTGGVASKTQNPHLPTQPEEIAADVYDCYNAGASVVAVHARRVDDLATCNADIYRRINTAIREKCDIVINNSTGGGTTGDMLIETEENGWEVPFAERLKGIDGGAEMCTLDPLTMVASFDGKEMVMNTSPSRIRTLAEKMLERGIKPEWEVFNAPHIFQDVQACIDAGLDEAPYYVNIVLGMHKGFQGTMPYSPRYLQQMVDVLPKGSRFCVTGMGSAQLPAAINSLLLGGNIRVGLEDNLFYKKGEVGTNLQLLERLVRIAGDMGFEPATPAEAREMLGLPLAHADVKPDFAV
ncbi:3-keto-5-aminohexanoate cleavage protein [Nocardia sp. R7R-8]|uniref:3-keto-5-aminohexanoate cleavage protein n=1 Tax=Nocardia sp. R7R-8 TaxID=3459304 RepID=UPI00403D6D27